MLFFGVFLRESSRTAAKSRTNLSTNSGKATKRLGRLAPNLVHVCKFIWECIYAKQIAPGDTRGQLAGFRGSTIQKSGKAVRFAPSADPHRNGYTPNKLLLETQGGTWRGGLGVKHSKVLGSCQTAGPSIGTNFGSRLRIDLEMDIG